MGKAKCIVVDDNIIITEMLSMFIDSFAGMDVLTASSVDEAILLYHENIGNIELITCDFNMPEKNGDVFFEFLQQEKSTIPFLLVTSESLNGLSIFDNYCNEKDFYYIAKPFSSDDLIKIIKQTIHKIKIDQSGEHVPVKMEKFLKYIHLIDEHQVFIKLASQKMIKISHQDEKISVPQIERYRSKGMKDIYLGQKDFLSFIKNIFTDCYKLLSDSSLSTDKKVSAQYNTAEGIHDALLNLGIPAVALKMATKTTEATIVEIEKNPRLGDLLSEILKGEDYKFEISLMSSYISAMVGKGVDWCNPQQVKKLCHASLFQDISYSIPKDISPMAFETGSDEFKKLPLKMRTLILNHPLDSLKIIDKIEIVTEDVRNIIVQHHERPDGTGYPRGLGAMSISPLSCIFIIAHDFSHRMITEGGDQACIDAIKQEFAVKYNKGNFKKPLKSFLALMDQEKKMAS